MIPGLSTGPTASPRRAATDAALHPDDSEDRYFVPDGTRHKVMPTLKQQQKTVEKRKLGH